MNKILFFISNCLSGIIRNRRRYTLFGIVIFIVSAVVLGALVLSIAANAFVRTEKALIGDIDTADEMVREYYYSTVMRADGIAAFSNILILAFSFLGIITVVFVTMLLQNERMSEVGIYYALGMNKVYIFFNLLTETVAFIMCMELLGIITSVGVLRLLFTVRVLPDLSGYLTGNSDLFTAVMIVSLIIIIIPSSMLLVKLVKSSPLKLLKSAD